MDRKLSHTEYLDAVLNILGKDSNTNYQISPNEIELYFQNKYKFGISDADIRLILKRLIKDEYAVQPLPGNHIYTITFDGILHLENGGYKQQEIRLSAENTRLEKLETSQRRLSFWVAGGTIALVLWEMLKYFVFEHHWYFYSF